MMKLSHLIGLGLLVGVVVIGATSALVVALTYGLPARGISQVCTSWDGPGHCQTVKSQETAFRYVVLVENSIIGDDFQRSCHPTPIDVWGDIHAPNYDLKTARRLPNVWVCRGEAP
jgi:hypothetical protein